MSERAAYLNLLRKFFEITPKVFEISVDISSVSNDEAVETKNIVLAKSSIPHSGNNRMWKLKRQGPAGGRMHPVTTK